ncbi:hypothetical protein CLM62_07045 [Streptomyces sp. SA15]|nr:hypothetical protein CLM62_07045 [Streptomyces sp. SA15]
MFAVGTQINGAPHIGTSLVQSLTFATARIRDKFGVQLNETETETADALPRGPVGGEHLTVREPAPQQPGFGVRVPQESASRERL